MKLRASTTTGSWATCDHVLRLLSNNTRLFYELAHGRWTSTDQISVEQITHRLLNACRAVRRGDATWWFPGRNDGVAIHSGESGDRVVAAIRCRCLGWAHSAQAIHPAHISIVDQLLPRCKTIRHRAFVENDLMRCAPVWFPESPCAFLACQPAPISPSLNTGMNAPQRWNWLRERVWTAICTVFSLMARRVWLDESEDWGIVGPLEPAGSSLRFTKVGDAGRSGSVRFRLVLRIAARIPGRRAAVKPVLNLLLYQFRRSPAYLPRLIVGPFSVHVVGRWWIFLCPLLLAVVEL